ncbi:MAG: hypothetical protein HUU55_15310 [Myxococcales bacterium]|nr:hypothetical protein [Myxococcales bacterium]
MQSEDVLFDKRLLERHLRTGKLSRAKYDAYLSSLPDLRDALEEVTADEDLLSEGTRTEVRIRAAREEEDPNLD